MAVLMTDSSVSKPAGGSTKNEVPLCAIKRLYKKSNPFRYFPFTWLLHSAIACAVLPGRISYGGIY